MSHTMDIQLEIHDQAALLRACNRLGLRAEQGTFKLFSSRETGTAVYLPNWQFPVVVKADGNVAADNYNGVWGDEKELNKLVAYYGLEKSKQEAEARGYQVEEIDEGNEITLCIQM